MKALLILAIISISQSRLVFPTKSSGNKEKTEPIPYHHRLLKGFIAGMALDSNLQTLIPCLDDTQGLAEDIKTAVLNVDLKHKHSLLMATKSMKKTLDSVLMSLEKCSSRKNDYLRLKHSLKVLEYPTSFDYTPATELKINAVDLLNDFKLLFKRSGESNWYEIGFYTGSILAKVCGTGFIISKG